MARDKKIEAKEDRYSDLPFNEEYYSVGGESQKPVEEVLTREAASDVELSTKFEAENIFSEENEKEPIFSFPTAQSGIIVDGKEVKPENIVCILEVDQSKFGTVPPGNGQQDKILSILVDSEEDCRLAAGYLLRGIPLLIFPADEEVELLHRITLFFLGIRYLTKAKMGRCSYQNKNALLVTPDGMDPLELRLDLQNLYSRAKSVKEVRV